MEQSHVVHKKSAFSKMRENPWIIATIVLGALLLVIALVSGFGMVFGGSQSVGEKVVNYLNTQVSSGTVTLESVSKENGLYKVMVNYQGQSIPVYASPDGKNLVSDLIPLDGSGAAAAPTPKDIPKTARPRVELFVMSYCPYGTQMEKAILPVAALLKDKIDFDIRYTHFTLHGEPEDTENFRQICIREEQGDKFLAYIQCTLNSTDPYHPADVNTCMRQLGINANQVTSCMNTKAADYYADDSQASQGYGVQGSPTLIINGVDAQVNRSPAAILSAVCSAFENAPEECNTELPTAQASPGFGYSASSADTAAIQCAV